MNVALMRMMKHGIFQTTTTTAYLKHHTAEVEDSTLIVNTRLKFGNHMMGGRHNLRGGNGGGRWSGGGGYGDGGYGRGGYDNYQGGYNNFGGNGMNPFNMPNNFNQNGLMQLMSAMASGFNMNPPPPPPARMSCGELRAHHAGMIVELTGRLIKKRVNRFVELRDRNGGAAQMVVLEDKYPRIARRIQNMPEYTLLTIVGQVMKRPSHSCNQTMPTGDIEVEVQEILNIDFSAGNKRPGDKRSYSTMAQQNYTGITSTEYKIAKSENILKYFENRDITCNDLRRKDIGKDVNLVGWIPSAKNTKFMQLKDGYGQTQIVVEDQVMQETCASAPDHTVLLITGKVLGRPRANINMKYETGEVEVMVDTVKILNPEDPYDGPIKAKDKVQKLSIDDLDEEDGDASEKNGEAMEDNDTSTPKVVKVADLNKFADRSHNCGELASDNIGEKVSICGWLEFQRMGKFLVLRDGYGQTQVLLTDKVKGLEAYSDGLSLETIVKVEGTVIPRPAATINPKMKTGHIEVEAEKVEVLNAAKKNLPFEVRKFNRAGERLRLTHRYIDLRFADMQHNLRMRSQVIMRMREYLINYLGFVEVETPTLFCRTPGGAQEFVVPTRKPGHFYSLVQSPQQFKQMLMAGAIDRYFQVARCYRDEATRPDRQPEFTQLDLELSFTNREAIMQLVEEVLRYSWPKEYSKIQTPFRRITYEEALEKYGTDKPDIRFGLTLCNVTDIIEKNQTFVDKFTDMASYALVVRGNEGFWNSTARKHYESLSKEFLGTLFVRKFMQYKDVLERLTNLLTTEVAQELIAKFDLEENDLLFLGIGEKAETQKLLGKIRVDYHNFLLEHNKARKNYDNKFVWIIDFPMFERNAETGSFESVHHPFTAPHSEDMDAFINSKAEDLAKIRSQAYDLILNGQEVGGGSMRIHDRDMQQFVLEQILKLPNDNLTHLLNALESGCPPHGGIALGLDRLMAIMCRTASIRDVIAFPKSLNGRDPLSNAPVPISDDEKALYHISVVENENEEATGHAQEDDDPDAARPPPSPLAMDEDTQDIKVEPSEPMAVDEPVQASTQPSAAPPPAAAVAVAAASASASASAPAPAAPAEETKEIGIPIKAKRVVKKK
uniref:Aminoacyl-transfer RNA synthetases class-II family profile domain-containing protein n=1 Tax=Glossina brevipalpis TaxID=37001 RepID=A0A1A9W5F1_9MUSC